MTGSTAAGEITEAALKKRLIDLESEKREDPMTNPVRRVAMQLSRWAGGETGAETDSHDPQGVHAAERLETLLQPLTARGFQARARKIAAYIGSLDNEENRAAIRASYTAIVETSTDFESFKQKAEHPGFGIVLTAHPTFGLRRDLRRALCELAAGETVGGAPLDNPAIIQRENLASALPHGPDQKITLEVERDQANEALIAIQDVLDIVSEEALAVAKDHFPEDWRAITPHPMSVASWVGYDLDGRNDIGWIGILKFRMLSRRDQLHRYLSTSVALSKAATPGSVSAQHLAAVQRLLEDAAALTDREFALLEETNSKDAESTRRMAAGLKEGDNRRLTETAALRDALQKAALAEESDDLAASILAFDAKVAVFGFGTAHIHVRLNASHLHNAVARAIGMEGAPEDPNSRRRYLAKLNTELDTVTPTTINFGSLMAERTTARSLFMAVRQILTYMDSDAPIRVLIAETESSFTVLAAVYFSKLFGVSDRVDISPLFETATALEKGADIIEALLDNPHYLSYIKGRGRLCIQTGFSDAGRYLGQLAASLAVERLHIKLARLMAARGLTEIEVLIFDTHGESIGRGAHPASLAQRFSHLASPMSRSMFYRNSQGLKQEISFQGGDGYSLFATPKLALGTIRQVLDHALSEPVEHVDDPFYEDPDHTLDFFLTIMRFNDQIVSNRDYANLIAGFGANFVPKMGSRTVQRQHEASRGVDRESLSQTRAITHNATLHQLGWLANTVGGVGAAMHRNLGWFIEMHGKSERLRQMIDMARHAAGRGSIDALMAYARIYDPNYWLGQAQAIEPSSHRDRLRSLSRHLDNQRRFERMSRVCRILAQDAIYFEEGLAAIGDTQPPLSANPMSLSDDEKADLLLLHAIRIAAIQQIFLLSTFIPRFASKLDFTRDDVIEQILNMEITAALEELSEIFPVSIGDLSLDGFESEATYTPDTETSYAREHQRIFGPIEALHRIVLRVSAAISYHTGAHG